MKNDLLKILVKVLLYALSLVAAYLGVISFSSCTSQHSVSGSGVTHIYTVDSTHRYHNAYLSVALCKGHEMFGHSLQKHWLGET